MRKFSFFARLLFLSFLLFSTLQAVEMDWGHDYNSALEQAKKEHKLVYLFIGADRCRFCKKFKNMTLSKEGVVPRMRKNFVLLFMSRDQHKIPDKFERYGVPRHYFLTPQGEIIRTEQGIWDVQGWYTILDEVLAEREDGAAPESDESSTIER
ncbi:MAG TPA: thioredoxin family protein [Epsilonproteobacteria bacterium]|nr:thioredoxin family protein [Campylobacterota bacterium]